MIGQMGSFDRPSAGLGDPLDLYLHGYVSSRIMNLGRDGAGGPGMPVSVAASHVDGLVLALSAFSHSYNYRSVVLFGHATLVEDADERLYAMELITESVVPGRWKNTRLPPNNAELQSTSILKVKIASGSLKVRAAQCSDEKYDMENEDVVNSIWTGVVPIHQTIGEPVPGPYNRVEPPTYLTEFADDFNNESKQQSQSFAKK
jgi:nitroimidazol reductase NimA-like FMN-containing flavoprotein (pyridoxamine 5'-phosphate oxidase superfamily)